jgi:predicted nuclease of predicted toxin-antitoxin system
MRKVAVSGISGYGGDWLRWKNGHPNKLEEAGIDTVHVGEMGLTTSEDLAILEKAHRSGRIVITQDANFHDLMALSGAASPSVIHMRIEGLRTSSLPIFLKMCSNSVVRI